MPYVVQDNLNGRILLHELEDDLMRTPPFARLTHLRQLGMGSWVYPGAAHTRAAHSIGVMYTVGEACRVLKLDEGETTLLRVAGLLHDIGHYPLSHCIESTYRAIGETSELERIAEHEPEDGASLLQRTTTMRVACEAATDKAMGEIVINEDPDIERVLDKHRLSGEFKERLAKIVAGTPTETLHTQLLNSDYDCDRLDYVRRDSVAAGVAYGQIGADYLLEQARSINHPPNSRERLMVFDKTRSIVALEQYLIARYGMYSQVYYHKTVRSLELLARAVQLGLAEAGRTYRSYHSIRDVIGTPAYAAFDDSHFWQGAAAASEDETLPPELRRLARRVIRREPLKLAYEYRTLTEPEKDLQYLLLVRLKSSGEDLQRLCQERGIDPQDVVVDDVKPIEFVPGVESVPADQLESLVADASTAVGSSDFLSPALLKLRQAPKVIDDRENVRLLTSDPGSLLAHLAGKRLYIIRFYLFDGSKADAKELHGALTRHVRLG